MNNFVRARGAVRGLPVPNWLGCLLVAGLLAGPVEANAQTRGQGPDAVLTFTEVDTLALPGTGRVTGWTWMGPDTLAVLSEIADSLSSSGDREVHLVFSIRDSLGQMREEQEDFTGVLDRALAWDGEFLWGCGDADDGSSILYKLRVDTLQVDEAYNTPGHRPTGMCFDGRFLWITDRDAGRVDRFDPEVKEITRSAVTPGFSPCGVAWDGRNMWLTDSGTGQLYRLSGSRRNWSGTVDPDLFMFRGEDVRLLHDGTRMWYLVDGESAAVEIRMD